jgi:gamma-glutamyltranspeptidase
VAEAIVELVRGLGGVMTAEDLAEHVTTFEPPVTTRYHGVDVFECAPNGQGITALIALNTLEGPSITLCALTSRASAAVRAFATQTARRSAIHI